MMTKKDFVKVAEILNQEVDDRFIKTNLYSEFRDLFKQENPRFDEEKFREAVFK